LFIIHGRKTANIKSFTDYQATCNECKNFGLEITVSQEYYHFYYIPFTYTGEKVVYMRCLNCGSPVRNLEQQNDYASKTKTPIFYFTIPILIAGLILLGIVANRMWQSEKAERIAHPQKEDIYLIRDDSKDYTQYYFLQVKNIEGDTVMVYHNNIVYSTFTSSLGRGDYFVTGDTLRYHKKDLIKMQEDGMINMIIREH
jgi:hypothetical protein